MEHPDVAVIDEIISNHIKTYLVTNFLNILMGGGDKTEFAIKDVLSKTGTQSKMQELIPKIDAAFIKGMISILTSSSDFCETINSMQIQKGETENTIIAKLKEGFSKPAT